MSNKVNDTATGVIEWARVFGEPFMDKEYPVVGGLWSIDLIVSDEERDRLNKLGLLGKINKKGKLVEPNRFKFKRKGINTKGVAVQPPKVVDSDKVLWDSSELIGNGSEGRVKFFAYEHQTSSEWGMGKYIDTIQVTKHVPYEAKVEVTTAGEEATTAEEDDDF